MKCMSVVTLTEVFSRKIILCSMIIFMSLCCFSSLEAAGNKTIKIGICGPMKFPAGEHSYIGAQMAAEEINSRGGVLVSGGLYDIEVVKADSNEYLSVSDAVSALERIITVNGVNFVIGGARSEAVLAEQEIMAEYKIPFIQFGGGSPSQTTPLAKDYDKYKYFFRTTTPHVNYQVLTVCAVLDLCIKKMKDDLGIEDPKVALVMEKISALDPMIKVTESLFPKLGAEIIGVWRPSPHANDLTAELTAIKAAGANIIFEYFTGPAGIIFTKQWGELEIPAILVGVNIEAQKLEYWKTTNGKCEYEMTLNPVVRAEVTKKTIPVYDKYVKKTGSYPFYTGLGSYDAVYLLKEAVERAGTLDSDAVVAALEKTDYLGVAGRIQFFPKGHKTPHDLIYGPRFSSTFCQQWRNGELLTVWPDGKSPNPKIGAGPGWEGVRFEGTVDAELPPSLINYWKNKK